jgi:hypothetical protein
MHFVNTNLPLTRVECAELADELTEAFKAKGRPHDVVVVFSQCTYAGSIDVDLSDEPS